MMSPPRCLLLAALATGCAWEPSSHTDASATDAPALDTAADALDSAPPDADGSDATRDALPIDAAPPDSFDYAAIATRLEDALPPGTTQRGQIDFFELEDCLELIDRIGNCQGNNPASPYGMFHLPPAPAEFPDPLYAETGLAPAWRLRPDEAVVVIGLLPPRHKYVSVRSYLLTRARTDGSDRAGLFASLGDSLSHPFLVTTELGDDPPWGEGFVLLSTANATTEHLLRSELTSILASLGHPTDVIHTDVLPENLPLRMGLAEADDQLTMLLRMALPADRDAAAAYRATPPVVVLRFTPTGAATHDALPTPTLRERTGGTDEGDLASGLLRLRDSVAALHPGAAVQTSRFLRTELEGYTCIARGTPCFGDNRDTSYSPSRAVRVDGTLEALYVVGVNHAATGDFTYSNVGAMSRERLVGFASIDDSMVAGSLEHFVPDLWLHPSVRPLLFVWKLARSCAGADEAYCTEIPAGPIGVNDGEDLTLIERAYLNVHTLVGADIDEIQRPWLIEVR